LVLVALPCAAFYLSSGRTLGEGDTAPVVMAADALLRTGDPEIGRFFEGPESRRWPQGWLPYYARQTDRGVYSNYPAGMTAFALPVVAAGRLLGADPYDWRVAAVEEKLAATLTASAAAAMFFLIALHLVRAGPALAVTAVFGLGSGMACTVSQGLWHNSGVLFWFLAAALAEFRQSRRPSATATVMLGLACGMLPACRANGAVVAAAVLGWVMLRDPLRAIRAGLVAAAAFAPWALFYWRTYGTPMGPQRVLLEPGWWSCDPWIPVGLLVSPARGLLVYQPWLLLGWAALLQAVRAMETRVRPPAAVPSGWPAMCWAVIVPHFALISFWTCWWGGHCWGSRLLTELLAPAALLCVRPMAALLWHPWWCWPALAAAAVAFLLNLPVLYADGWAWLDDPESINFSSQRLWHWSRPPFLYPLGWR
jgi:hypothetical protein